MRFYVPGKSKKGKGSDAGSGGEETDVDEDGNEISAAEALHNAIKEKADIGAVVGDSIVVFEDVLVLTPRLVVKFSKMKRVETVIDMPSEVASRSNFSRTPSVSQENRPIIEFHSRPSIGFSSYPKSMTSMYSLFWAWILPSGRVRLDILSS